jgi:hypothetical protein
VYVATGIVYVDLMCCETELYNDKLKCSHMGTLPGAPENCVYNSIYFSDEFTSNVPTNLATS